MVELVDTKSVVVTIKCEEDMEESCVVTVNKVIECVMNSLLELFKSSALQFFLLDSTEDSDLLSKDNHFAVKEVEEYLSSQGGNILSQTGRRFMQPTKLIFLRKLVLWNSCFPLDYITVLHYLEDVSKDVLTLGLHLKLRPNILEAIDSDFPIRLW